MERDSCQARTYVEAGEMTDVGEETSLAALDLTTLDANARARWLYKRRLYGMVNVRTDGQELYAARRVAAGYWWESYGPLAPGPRPVD